MNFACCPFMRLSIVLTAGILGGMGLQSWLAGGNSAEAQQQLAGPGAEKRLRDLKLELPPVSRPTNTLVSALRVGDLLFVSGTGPGPVDGKDIVGRLGQDLDVRA